MRGIKFRGSLHLQNMVLALLMKLYSLSGFFFFYWKQILFSHNLS